MYEKVIKFYLFGILIFKMEFICNEPSRGIYEAK